MLFATLDLRLRNLAKRYPAGIALMYLNVLLPVGIGCFFLFSDNYRLTARRNLVPEAAE
jgi:hypothetical protein